MAERTVTAALVIIGNEILSGRTQDANLAFLATRPERGRYPDARSPRRPGCRGRHRRGGERAALAGTTTSSPPAGSARPTTTSRPPGIAKASASAYGRHPEAERRLLAYYPPEKVNPARMKMARDARGGGADRQPCQRGAGVHHRQCPRAARRTLDPAGDVARAEAGLKGGATVVCSRTITVLCPKARSRGTGEIQASPPDGRDRQLSVHAPGPLRHQPRAAQRRPGSDRRRGRGRSWPRQELRRRGAGPVLTTCRSAKRAVNAIARLAELVDARDLKSRVARACRFESGSGHQQLQWVSGLRKLPSAAALQMLCVATVSPPLVQNRLRQVRA